MAKVLLRRLTPVLVAATAAAVLVGCSTSEPPTTTAESVSATESTAPSVTLTPALDHLHGLHLGADGTVLAGSHTGLGRVCLM
ncbi:hypothetical protein [Mycolicibacterium alvei]|uniref:hypothetical protein n=1 Tax=Mycolicibacterium alvei TaxID=67081 RepID=UPI0015D429AC|nr:hypothetical protein [Mycolicibacterium alvei]MCV7003097.1 hypothetical protein [Mycolicibacterium alvei]